MSRPGAVVPAPSDAGRRLADALARSTPRERLVLALLLVERLSPAEVASALDCPVAEVERAYRLLIGSARAALRRRGRLRPSRALARASQMRPRRAA